MVRDCRNADVQGQDSAPIRPQTGQEPEEDADDDDEDGAEKGGNSAKAKGNSDKEEEGEEVEKVEAGAFVVPDFRSVRYQKTKHLHTSESATKV